MKIAFHCYHSKYLDYAADYQVEVSVVGNKVADPADEAFLRSHVGPDLLASLGVSRHVRAAEQGRPGPIDELEPAGRAVLDAMREAVDATPATGRGSPTRRRSSTSATPARGPTPGPARTLPTRSTPSSPSDPQRFPFHPGNHRSTRWEQAHITGCTDRPVGTRRIRRGVRRRARGQLLNQSPQLRDC